MPDPEIQKVKQEILQYLSSRPSASDDLEGITRFWVTRQRIEAAVRTVERAIRELVADGSLERINWQAPDGRTLGTRYHRKSETRGDS